MTASTWITSFTLTGPMRRAPKNTVHATNCSLMNRGPNEETAVCDPDVRVHEIYDSQVGAAAFRDGLFQLLRDGWTGVSGVEVEGWKLRVHRSPLREAGRRP